MKHETMWQTKLGLLTKEYELRTSEAMFHSQRYHRQARYLQLFIVVLITIYGALVSGGTATVQARLPESVGVGVADVILFIFLALGICIAFYLFSNLLDALFLIFINGARLSALETKINLFVREEILIWDKEIIREWLGTSVVRSKVWVMPPLLVGIWSFLIFLGIATTLSALCYILLPGIFWIYSLVILLLILFHFYQLIALNTTGIKALRKSIFTLSGLKPPNNDRPEVG